MPFLDIVAQRQPGAVRLLISGRGPGSSVSVNSAHQHLVKPLRGAAVFARLAEALRLGLVLSDPNLQSVVSRLTTVPSLPPVYMAIMTELRKEEASARRIGELICRDGGMAAKVLQLVNSPYFGFRMAVTEPTQAVQLMGLAHGPGAGPLGARVRTTRPPDHDALPAR